MTLNCFRCSGSAFATLKIEAAIGSTRLRVRGGAAEAGICASCMLGLADWLERGREVENKQPAGRHSSRARILSRLPEGIEAVRQSPFADTNPL
jgi:hypothetical protein